MVTEALPPQILGVAGGEENTVQPLWTTVGQSLKKLNRELAQAQQAHFRGCARQDVHLCSQEQLSQVKRQKQPKCPSVDDWTNRMWCIHTTDCYAALKKEGNRDLRYKVDEP